MEIYKSLATMGIMEIMALIVELTRRIGAGEGEEGGDKTGNRPGGCVSPSPPVSTASELHASSAFCMARLSSL